MFSKRMNHLFMIAKNISQRSSMALKLGALVVKNGKVLGRGFNDNIRTCVNGNLYPGVHAEHSAIMDYSSKTNFKKGKLRRRREKGGYDRC